MTKSDEEKQPAQVPGDAESPPKGETDRTAEHAVRRIDVTEPVQSGETEPSSKSS
jgi:hypothetical protein